MSGTQEMPHKYFPLYMCMIKLLISSRPLLSFMIDVNNPYFRPQGVNSFWFAGINKCKSDGTSGAARSRNPAPSGVVSGCLPRHPGVLTNQASGQTDASSSALEVTSLGLSFVVGWSLKSYQLCENTAKTQGETSPGLQTGSVAPLQERQVRQPWDSWTRVRWDNGEFWDSFPPPLHGKIVSWWWN